jgi:hypothetical protein
LKLHDSALVGGAGCGSPDGGVEAGGFGESVGGGGAVGVSPSNDGDDGAKTAKDPTAAASFATRLSRSPAIALPAALATSDLIAELSGAPEALT